jgi:hypothetical protein
LVPVGLVNVEASFRSIKSYASVPLRLKGKGAYNWVEGLVPVGPTECGSFLAEYKISPEGLFKAERKGGGRN